MKYLFIIIITVLLFSPAYTADQKKIKKYVQKHGYYKHEDCTCGLYSTAQKKTQLKKRGYHKFTKAIFILWYRRYYYNDKLKKTIDFRKDSGYTNLKLKEYGKTKPCKIHDNVVNIKKWKTMTLKDHADEVAQKLIKAHNEAVFKKLK